MKEENNIGNLRKIDDILENDRLIKIYGLLPNKELKKEFLDIYLSTYSSKLEEKFNDRLNDEFEENENQINQRYLKENKKNRTSIKDILRSRRRDPIRKGATERINDLIMQLKSGNYISDEDSHFLAKHLAGRKTMRDFTSIGCEPTTSREDIMDLINDYKKAKTKELKKDVTQYINKQNLEQSILDTKAQIVHLLNRNRDLNDEKLLNSLKNNLQQLEEMEKKENFNNSNINSMINEIDPNFDMEKNSVDLEELIDILDKENEEIIKDGVKLPETGLKEDDVIEIPKDVEELKGKIQDCNYENEKHPTYVVNTQASLEKDMEQNDDIIVVEPVLGTSIKDFAKSIMESKKSIVGKFNDFDINSSDYKNAEEIVEAYEKQLPEHRRGKDKQEKITPAEIESVVIIDPRALQIMNEISDTKQLVIADDQKNIGLSKE